MFDFLDIKTLFTIGHLFGVALGAGGAFMSDLMYMRATKDKVINQTELTFLKLGSTMVWIGLGLLILSGALLYSLDPVGYLASSKFITKMIIVVIITINGVIFHFIHTPVLGRTVGKEMHTSNEFQKRSFAIYMSGAISMVSWSAAIVLGALRGIPYSITEALLAYGVVVAIAMAVAEYTRRHFLKE
jgi:hypothetical protein